MSTQSDVNYRYFEKESVFIPTPGATAGVVKLVDLIIEKEVFLGHGSYGDVRSCKHKLFDLKLAIKTMRKNLNMDISHRKDIERDVNTLLNHSHRCDTIVNFHGYIETDDEVHLIMEEMDTCFRKILDKCQERGETILERMVVAIIQELCCAVEYLHSNNMMHRDIKPANILFNKDGKVKLADFGKARMLGESHEYTLMAGTQKYYSPERFSQVYDNRCDIWSIGITAIELLTGEHPITAYGKKLGDAQVNSGKYWTEQQIVDNKGDIFHLPADGRFDGLRDFVDLCLTRDYNERPNITEIKDNVIFADHNNPATREQLAAWYNELINPSNFGKIKKFGSWMFGGAGG